MKENSATGGRYDEDTCTNWKYLTLQNRFIFSKVMQDPENSLPLIQYLFPDSDIRKIEYIETEKTAEGILGSKGVRYDVYLKDRDQCAYTLEMQVQNRGNIIKRSRYYSSMMDEDSLNSGQDYDLLPASYVIFICPFDLFDTGLHKYTFRNYCEEVPGLLLKDETVKVFLNTTSMAGDISEPLKRLLDYIDGRLESSATDDPYIHQVHQAVEKAKTNAVWRREYMQWQAEMRHEKKIVAEEARAEGLAEGRAEGLAEGRAKGLAEGREEGLAKGLAEGRTEGMILGTIETLRDDGKTEEEIRSRLISKYRLTEKEAEGYMDFRQES